LKGLARVHPPRRLQPWRTEDFKISPGPLLIDKIRDLISLYLTYNVCARRYTPDTIGGTPIDSIPISAGDHINAAVALLTTSTVNRPNRSREVLRSG
jgi:hypothetical protein